jgi:hypothetical protein
MVLCQRGDRAFELRFADAIHRHKQTQRAIAKYTGETYEPDKDPIVGPGYRAPDGWHRPDKRRRSPVHTQYKRKPETARRDEQALELRVTFGLTYQQLAEQMGYSSRQVAHDAVRRAQRDRIVAHAVSRGQADKPSLARRARHSVVPPVKVTTVIPKARRGGVKACGHYCGRGVPVVYVKRRQWCLDCGLVYAGLTWEEIQRDPVLLAESRLGLSAT